jgi:imidazolonepropionase-like amidohydrolase
MLPVLDRKLPLIVRANRADQIRAAVGFASRENVRLIISEGYDAELCAPLLKKHNIPVILGGTLRLPLNRDDAYDAAYTLPERLRRAGVKFCIGMGGRFSDSNLRNLPYNAAMAVGFGLPQDEALRAITLYPAEILGVSDRVGSLTVGKDATLFVTDGDILETPTQVELAFIQGRPVDLSNRHKRLWNKYQEKYRRLDKEH